MWQFEAFRLDVVDQSLYRVDERIPLTPKPFAVLQYLVEHAGRLVTQDELLDAIWPETHVQPEVLRRYILEIRRALGDNPESPRFIETVTRRGYRFIAEVTPQASNAGCRGHRCEEEAQPAGHSCHSCSLHQCCCMDWIPAPPAEADY
jgi:DNA-binding winged helix-turn-helix (wHTH) protein